jgi:hypothetical protein
MLLSMWSCASEVLLVDLFGFVRVIALDLLRIWNFQLVSHVAQKVFDLESWNFTGIMLSMWSCAPLVLLVDLFALDLVKICNCQHVLQVAQKVFNLGSWKFTGMLISMCSCAPWYFYVDLFSICRVIAIDLIKICNFQLVLHIAQKYFT